MSHRTRSIRPALPLLLGALLPACGGPSDAPRGTAASELTGSVTIDGSSTVFPITEAVAEEFRAVAPNARVTVGVSGTGGGFARFARGETQINDASRPIKPSERDAAAQGGVGFIELPIAFDGLSIVVHRQNTWVDHLTVGELRLIWQAGSTVATWADVRPSWPAEKIALYGAGTDSGTFDYFTEAINGKAGACRSDFTASEDDNVLVQGVAGDRNALGFFGYAYFKENQERLRAVPIDGGPGPVAPSEQTINDGSYAPLSRPLFLYVNAAAVERPEVAAFLEFYLEHAAQLAAEVGYVGLPAAIGDAARRRLAERVTGSVYENPAPDATLAGLYGADG